MTGPAGVLGTVPTIPDDLAAAFDAVGGVPAAGALSDGKKLPRHKFWGAGEADCPPELKASNGELHTMRCKVCGDGWRKSRDVCFGAFGVDLPAVPAFVPGFCGMPGCTDCEKHKAAVGVRVDAAPTSEQLDDAFYKLVSPGLPPGEMESAREWFRLGATEFAAGVKVDAPSLSALDDLAKVYASNYASPHHITFTVVGLCNLIAALGVMVLPEAPKRHSLCGKCMTPHICAEDGPGCARGVMGTVKPTGFMPGAVFAWNCLEATAAKIDNPEVSNTVREFLMRAWHHEVLPAINAADGVLGHCEGQAMSGLRRICKAYGSMTVSDNGRTIRYVWDYVADEPVPESEMPFGSERHKASERARWQPAAGVTVPASQP